MLREFGIVVAIAMLVSPVLAEEKQELPIMPAEDSLPAVIQLERGQIRVLRASRPLNSTAGAVVGLREVADVNPISDTTFAVTGFKDGRTSIALLDQGGKVIKVLEVQVGKGREVYRREVVRVRGWNGKDNQHLLSERGLNAYCDAGRGCDPSSDNPDNPQPVTLVPVPGLPPIAMNNNAQASSGVAPPPASP